MNSSEDKASSILAMEVLQQFRLIFGSMKQYFRLVEERCGMPGSQMWVLQEVERSPGIGINELAVRMGIHQSTCSLLVDKLVAQACLSKQRLNSDLRRVGVFLAEKGVAALAALPGPAEGILPEALSDLPMVVLKTLNINLDELIRHLPGKDEASAGMPLADMLGKQQEAGDKES
jgi:DNA-binding MarR family transcriptional regulator